MEKEANFETSPLNTQDAKAEAATTLTLDATNGDKIKALRIAQHMSMVELARRASMSDRAIRYIESNQREPSVDAIQKIAAALGVTTDYFMDEATFQQELNDDHFYADIRKKYGSRGVAQAKKIKKQTTALFAGGELSEEDQAAFRGRGFLHPFPRSPTPEPVCSSSGSVRWWRSRGTKAPNRPAPPALQFLHPGIGLPSAPPTGCCRRRCNISCSSFESLPSVFSALVWRYGIYHSSALIYQGR